MVPPRRSGRSAGSDVSASTLNIATPASPPTASRQKRDTTSSSKLPKTQSPAPAKRSLPPNTICVSEFLNRNQQLTAMPAATTSTSMTNARKTHNAFRSRSSLSSSSATAATVLAAVNDSTAGTKPSTAERNIDNVVLGEVLFRAWYPSYHVKEIVGREIVDGKKEMLERLYVCKHCFKYSKELMSWMAHVKVCVRSLAGRGVGTMIPGGQIYVHPPDGTWSVWEVDGELDTLYCQNLSLFAKLFLDNKSVFFDVTGFNYFLLVHKDHSTGEEQVVGFFSKEKMSWDNNNLACILIFPPWQRKGLGALLMAVSYEISRRECILGGPEKPISDLGKKGYLHFWSVEIARYLLIVKDTDRKKKKGLLTLEQISKDTWICVDDCLAALRYMNIAVPAGKGKGDVLRVKIDKEKVREWAIAKKESLEPVIDVDGFAEGYGYQMVPGEEMEQGEGDEEEDVEEEEDGD